jgi:hypothetical protein
LCNPLEVSILGDQTRCGQNSKKARKGKWQAEFHRQIKRAKQRHKHTPSLVIVQPLPFGRAFFSNIADSFFTLK